MPAIIGFHHPFMHTNLWKDNIDNIERIAVDYWKKDAPHGHISPPPPPPIYCLFIVHVLPSFVLLGSLNVGALIYS